MWCLVIGKQHTLLLVVRNDGAFGASDAVWCTLLLHVLLCACVSMLLHCTTSVPPRQVVAQQHRVRH